MRCFLASDKTCELWHPDPALAVKWPQSPPKARVMCCPHLHRMSGITSRNQGCQSHLRMESTLLGVFGLNDSCLSCILKEKDTLCWSSKLHAASQGDPWRNPGAAKPPCDSAPLETHLLALLVWSRSLLPSHPNMQPWCQRGFHNLLCDSGGRGEGDDVRVGCCSNSNTRVCAPFPRMWLWSVESRLKPSDGVDGTQGSAQY